VVVFNRNRTTAIAIRRNRDDVVLVPLVSGILHVLHINAVEFQQEWVELSNYSIDLALTKFIDHAQRVGATKEALTALLAIKADAQTARFTGD
jgi:hypothetical protein